MGSRGTYRKYMGTPSCTIFVYRVRDRSSASLGTKARASGLVVQDEYISTFLITLAVVAGIMSEM